MFLAEPALVEEVGKQGDALAKDMGFGVSFDSSERGRHHGDHHVEDDEDLQDGADDEDQLEEPEVLRSSLLLCKRVADILAVANRKSEGVEDTFDEAINAQVGLLFRVLVKDPVQECLGYHEEAEHSGKRGRVLHDLFELAHEVGEEVEDFDSFAELHDCELEHDD